MIWRPFRINWQMIRFVEQSFRIEIKYFIYLNILFVKLINFLISEFNAEIFFRLQLKRVIAAFKNNCPRSPNALPKANFSWTTWTCPTRSPSPRTRTCSGNWKIWIRTCRCCRRSRSSCPTSWRMPRGRVRRCVTSIFIYSNKARPFNSRSVLKRSTLGSFKVSEFG